MKERKGNEMLRWNKRKDVHGVGEPCRYIKSYCTNAIRVLHIC